MIKTEDVNILELIKGVYLRSYSTVHGTITTTKNINEAKRFSISGADNSIIHAIETAHMGIPKRLEITYEITEVI